MRVEASSMLMISSATSILMSSSSARAISNRWSWPPLSWWGYLPRTWSGSSRTASSDAPILWRHSVAPTPGKYASLIMARTRSALKMGL
jgi:hypothetical protein